MLWKSVTLFVVPKWFLPTDAANYDTIVVLDLCWIESRNLSSTPACVGNVHHLYYFPECLIIVALEIPSIALMMMIAKIYRR